MLSFKGKNLYCPSGDFYLDPKQSVKTALISHAHGDHAIAGHHTVYCTAFTAAAMQLRFGVHCARQFCIKAFHEPFFIGPCQIEFIPAGHILGSAQILIKNHGNSILYTGDIYLEKNDTAEAYQIAKADILLTESTFAYRNLCHPHAQTELQKLLQMEDQNIILYCYALGKAQRISNMLAHTPRLNRQLYIHPHISPYHQLYEKYHINLGEWKPYRRAEFKRKEKKILIAPPAAAKAYYGLQNTRQLMVSGWKSNKLGVENLNISDHVDWIQILKLVENSEAKEIWTTHGYGQDLQDFYQNKIIVKELI